MSGRLFAVVGPSGAGKDTLMAAIARSRPDLHIARRVITRPTEAGGEPFEGVSSEEFERRRRAGAFLFDWSAHGLSYGIPASLRDVMARGDDALFNGSRTMLDEAARAADLHVLHVTARPEVLAERLAARGRESAGDIARRLARVPPPFPADLTITEIDNSGALEDAVQSALAALRPEGATVP